MQNNPLVSIQIVTWNRKNELDRSIRSAVAQSYPNFEVVVIDNDSSDGTESLVRNNYPEVTYVRLPKNIGCPSGRNEGFKHCKGDYVYQLDDDGWLKDDAVEAAVRRAEQMPDVGVVMSRIFLCDEADNIVGKLPVGKDKSGIEPHFIGCCSMIRRRALDEVGAYPDDFFRQGEESNLALRLLDKGWFCFLETESIMFHAPSLIGRNPKAFLTYELINKNKTALRLWPFPWMILRPFATISSAVTFALKLKYPQLPFLVIKQLILDLPKSFLQRKPVRSATFRKFRNLVNSSATRI